MSGFLVCKMVIGRQTVQGPIVSIVQLEAEPA